MFKQAELFEFLRSLPVSPKEAQQMLAKSLCDRHKHQYDDSIHVLEVITLNGMGEREK